MHTPAEDKLVVRMWNKHPEWLLDILWQELRTKHGYTRNRATLYRALRRMGIYKQPKPKKKPRLKACFPPMEFAGQQVQIDVKYVPIACHSGSLGDKRLYQFTAVDAYSRWEFKMIYDDHSSTSAVRFLAKLIQKAPFAISCIQTDNGTEFTNRFVPGCENTKSAFEKALCHMDIQHRLIRPATPKHNGKVERVHRFDQRLFYSKNIFYSLADANRKLAAYLSWCNNRPRSVLSNRSPSSVLFDFLSVAA